MRKPCGENPDSGLLFDAPFWLPKSRGKRKIGTNTVVRHAVKILRKYLDETFYLMMIPEEWSDDLFGWWQREVANSLTPPCTGTSRIGG